MTLFNTNKLNLSSLEIEPVVNAFIPKSIYIPVPNNFDSLPEVVTEGTVLDKYYEVNVHSSIPGNLTGTKRIVMANGKFETVAVINLSGEFSFVGKPEKKSEWSLFSQNHILQILDEKGVLNTFKIPKVFSKEYEETSQIVENRNLVVRLFDEDITCTTDSFIFSEYCLKVLEGSAIIAKAMNAENITFLYSNEQKKLISSIETEKLDFFGSFNVSFVKCFSQKIGFGVKEEINVYLKKQKMLLGTCFTDSSSAYEAFEAVALSRPILEKIVQINSSLLNKSRFFKVRIGTPIKNLVLECGGAKTQPKKIVINGLVHGLAISELDAPIMNDIKSITLLASKEVPDQKQYDCYRCGSCARICPVHIRPYVLFEHYTMNKPLTENAKNSVLLCTNCGRCNTVCASRIPIAQSISILQDVLNEK